VLGWLADVILAVLLAIGVSWSLVERRVTGQVVVDEGERR
jgi:lipopolysaccharide export system protein LptC